MGLIIIGTKYSPFRSASQLQVPQQSGLAVR